VGEHGQDKGEVGRPGPAPAIGCNELVPIAKLGEHVWFDGTTAVGPPARGRRSQQLGGGWVRDILRVGTVTIEVQTHSNPGLRDHILGSVRQVSTDSYGCPADHPVTTGGWTRPHDGLDWDAAVTGVSICRYALDDSGGHPLIASVRRGQDEAAELLNEIRAASIGEGPGDSGLLPNSLGSEVTVLRFDTAEGLREIYLRYAGTDHNGFDNGTEVRRLTRESVAFMTGPLLVRDGSGLTVDVLPHG
jgi:hypothetical protein